MRDFDVTHEKRMHLILARRDLTGFQHLHPEMAADGTWSTQVTLPQAGSYRLFADFSYQDEAITLAVTPSSLLSLRSIRFAHDAQVMPVIGSSTVLIAPPPA